MEIYKILGHFDNVKECACNARGERQWSVRCPAHDDRVNSLHIALSRDGKVLCNCKAGCDTNEILRKVGLRMQDLFPEEKPKRGTEIAPAVEVDVYQYKDVQNGIPLRKHRMRHADGSKSFWWDRLENGRWQSGLNGLTPNPYGLDSLKDSDIVYVVEGEKDVKTAHSLNLPCVTTPDGGGKKKKWQDAYTEAFRGKTVYILPDNDGPGLDYARFIYEHIKDVARKACILNLQVAWPEIPEKGDISDMVDALGKDAAYYQLACLSMDADADDPAVILPPVACEDESSPPPSESLKEAAKADWTLQLERSSMPPHNLKATINNFYIIMKNEPFYSRLRFNLMTNRPEVYENGKVRDWNDTDDVESRRLIEARYHIHNRDKHSDALKIFWHEHECNPLREKIESLTWDGVNRIEHFLSYCMKVEDTPYAREISLLIFSAAIHRLMEPGCKFDEVPVLVGKQGSGKSTIAKWLAMDDRYYTVTRDMSGDQRSIEALSGAWIVEIAELAAFNATSVERLKAFISVSVDRYRLPYDRNISDLPRSCFFIGTTNNETFLTDKTGNRRFYPVLVHSSAADLFAHEKEYRALIAQCYAEGLVRYREGTLLPYPNPALIEEFRRAQENAMEDDWRPGAIDEFVRKQVPGDPVCIKQICNYLKSIDSTIDRKELNSREIGQILNNSKLLKKTDERPYLPAPYGRQRVWIVLDPCAQEGE